MLCGWGLVHVQMPKREIYFSRLSQALFWQLDSQWRLSGANDGNEGRGALHYVSTTYMDTRIYIYYTHIYTYVYVVCVANYIDINSRSTAPGGSWY